MARDSRYDVVDRTEYKYFVSAYDPEMEEQIEFGFTTRAEYEDGIEEFARRTYAKGIVSYAVSERRGVKNLFEATGEDTETVRAYVLIHLEEVADELG